MKKNPISFIRNFIGSILVVLLVSPVVASAQSSNFRDLDAVIDTMADFLQKLIPLVIGAAVLVFLWGILRFVLAHDADDRTAARNFMIFGVIALFVMVSVWGLVNFFRNTLGFSNRDNVPLPPGIPGIR